MLRKCWANHSLTIVLGIAGVLLIVIGMCLEPGKVFDLLLSLGAGLLTVVAFNLCAGKLREINKPEEPPK